jgi:lipid II:glycine glycyltransferase (peptidoglycan interpeptide bridge formation enzyme)
LADKENKAVFIGIYEDGELVAHRILFRHNEVLHDWYAGSDSKKPKLNANDFAVYHSLKYGSEKGFKTFDFGGAGVPNKPYGVRSFKLQFGGTLINQGIFYKEHNKFLATLLKSAIYLRNALKK